MGHTLKDSITDSVYTHSTEDDLLIAAEPIILKLQELLQA